MHGHCNDAVSSIPNVRNLEKCPICMIKSTNTPIKIIVGKIIAVNLKCKILPEPILLSGDTIGLNTSMDTALITAVT